MQTYLCSRCKRKVPRSDLVDHRRECGGDMREHKGFFGRIKSGFGLLAVLALALALAALSLFLGRSSFQSLADMRQLERVPPSSVRAILPGEINLNGAAAEDTQTLQAPNTRTPCVYYRYKVERREKDSDGDTRWVTEKDVTKFVPFLLRDETGAVQVRPDDGVDFSVRESWSDRRGDKRYTEYRIDPGDSLFIFGYAQRKNDQLSVVFHPDGHYQPIISEYGETRERVGMAGGSIAKVWFGLVALALALSFVIFAFRQHRLLLYFTILNLAVMIYLVSLGLQMMKLDLQAALDRMETSTETVRTEIREVLSSRGISWNGEWKDLPAFSSYATRGLSPDEQTRLREIRLNLARGVERVRRQRGTFPEVMLAPLWGIPYPEPLPLPEAQRERLETEGDGLEQARVPPKLGWILIGGSLLAGIAAFFAGFRKIRFKRCMENLPTSSTAGAAYGLTEFKGVVDLAESADLLKAPLSHQPCVQYRYKVEHKRGSGKKAKWVTVVDEKRRIPFLCRDAEGVMLVDPAGAEVHTGHKTHRRRGRRRYTETRLEHGDPLYAIGECAIDPAHGDRLYLRKPEEADAPFILGNLTESHIMLRIARVGILLLNVSFAGLLLTALLLFGLSGSFAATDYLAAALAAPLFMTLITLALHYNDLVFLRERARRNWSNIDVSLKKRADLIPKIESISKALMEHERGLHEAMADMRKLYGAEVARTPEGVQQYMEAEHASLQTLMIRSEDYPDLKSDRQTALLMRTLIVMENEISLMRNGYNDAVETYNTRIQSFPDAFFAKLFHFTEESLVFADTDVVRIPPSIQALWEKEQTPPPPPEPAEADPETGDAPVPPPADDAAPASTAALAAASPEAPDDEENADTGAEAAFLALLEETPDDPVVHYHRAEELYPRLRDLTPRAYRQFRAAVLRAMEADDAITVLEFALQKSLSRHLDPVYGLSGERPIRHPDLSTLLDEVSELLSLFAMLEETPDTRRAAFDTGVAHLNHKPSDDFTFRETDPGDLAEFDDVLEEIAHAAPMHRANVMYACEALVNMNDDISPRQHLLLNAVADTLGRKRPT